MAIQMGLLKNNKMPVPPPKIHTGPLFGFQLHQPGHVDIPPGTHAVKCVGIFRWKAFRMEVDRENQRFFYYGRGEDLRKWISANRGRVTADIYRPLIRTRWGTWPGWEHCGTVQVHEKGTVSSLKLSVVSDPRL